MTALTEADAALRTVAKAAATSAALSKQYFENMVQPTDVAPPWVSIALAWSDSNQASLGSTGFDRSSGLITFVVATEVGRGAAPGFAFADAIRAYLRTHSPGSGVTLRPATIRSVGASAGPGLAYWQTNVFCPFFVTHRS